VKRRGKKRRSGSNQITGRRGAPENDKGIREGKEKKGSLLELQPLAPNAKTADIQAYGKAERSGHKRKEKKKTGVQQITNCILGQLNEEGG